MVRNTRKAESRMPRHSVPDLEQYRSYLKALADMQLNPRIRAKEDVSDVVQLTLMQAHQHLMSYRGASEAELRAWLKRILINRLINLSKRYTAQKRDVRRELSIDHQLEQSAARLASHLAGDQSTPSQRMMNEERGEQVAEAMATLLDDERTAVLLKHVHNFRVAEIAEYLDRTPDAIAGLLRRALKKLRNRLDVGVADD